MAQKTDWGVFVEPANGGGSFDAAWLDSASMAKASMSRRETNACRHAVCRHRAPRKKKTRRALAEPGAFADETRKIDYSSSAAAISSVISIVW